MPAVSAEIIRGSDYPCILQCAPTDGQGGTLQVTQGRGAAPSLCSEATFVDKNNRPIDRRRASSEDIGT